jgi:hypothetical protein
LSNNTCVCNTTTSANIGTACIYCSQLQYSTGPATGNTACTCSAASATTWYWNTTSLTGSCYCNSTTSVMTSSGTCYSCKTVTYGSTLGNGTNCGCLANFVWNATALTTCYCPTVGFILSTTAKTCTPCNTVDSVVISTSCVNCTLISGTNGPNVGNTACQCIAPYQWSWNTTSLTGSCICNATF